VYRARPSDLFKGTRARPRTRDAGRLVYGVDPALTAQPPGFRPARELDRVGGGKKGDGTARPVAGRKDAPITVLDLAGPGPVRAGRGAFSRSTGRKTRQCDAARQYLDRAADPHLARF